MFGNCLFAYSFVKSFVCLFVRLIVSFKFKTCKKQIRILSDLLRLIVRCVLCKKKNAFAAVF